MLVTLLGATILLSFRPLTFPPLSWSDEIVYAVMGRNIASGLGVVSGYYHPASLLERGFPLGDVHMPGHALLLGASFYLLGHHSYAAFLPCQVSFVVSGLLLFRLGASLAGRSAGYAAALMLYLFPPFAPYAHSAMAETPLALLGIAFLLAWLGAMEAPTTGRFVLLALLLGAGITYRETFLVLVPAVLYALGCSPRERRLRAAAAAGVVFGLYLLLIGWPLYRGRAPYPHVLSAIAARNDAGGVLAALSDNVRANFRALWPVGGATEDWAYGLSWFAFVGVALLWPALSGRERRIAAYALFTAITTWVVLLPVYPLRGWAGTRVLLFAVPAALLVLASVATRIPRPWRLIAAGATACALVGSSVAASRELAEDRARRHGPDQALSKAIREHTGGLRPRVVMAHWAYSYGWDEFPTPVIPWGSVDASTLSALEKVVPVDVVVVPDAQKKALMRAMRRGLLHTRYRLVPDAFPDGNQHLFVSEDCPTLDAAPAGGGPPQSGEPLPARPRPSP